MAKKKSELSRLEKQRQAKYGDITLNDTLKKQLSKLKGKRAKPDKDTPGLTDWSLSVVGKFYRPVKKQITLRLDADTLSWFKQQPEKYQALINRVCREYMNKHQQHSEKKS